MSTIKRSSLNVGLSLVVFTAAHLMLVFMVQPKYFFVHSAALVSGMILLLIFKPAVSFTFIVVIILLYGAGLTVYSGQQSMVQAEQIELMVLHLGYLLSILPIWAVVTIVQGISADLDKKKQEINHLKKFINPDMEILTFTEFIERANFILTGMKRRKEDGYLIRVDVKAPAAVDKTLREVVGHAVKKSIRHQYDFFTEVEPDSYLIFLQNTHAQGCELVKSRLRKELRSKVNVIELPVEINSSLIEELPKSLHDLNVKRVEVVS